jgi:SAM-dependent MidA family methyltransferase
MTPLGERIAARIAEAGPMRLDAYMALCLGDPELGYYATRDPLGGDFVTAPEISQMFGEIVGAWVAQVWADAGRPAPFVLAELGPGRGTLMRDLLRVARRVPGLGEAAAVWLVETSPVLKARQAETLAGEAVAWAADVRALPEGPLIAVANEFFDALPIRQFQRVEPFWRERVVGGRDGALAFAWDRPRPEPRLDARFPLVPDGAIVEVCPAAEAIARGLGDRIARNGGAALIVDYGAWEGSGDTLQALAGGRPAEPLAAPGAADLTAHVGFRALAEAARPARAHGPVAQGAFLERLGITARAEALARGREGPVGAAIVAAHRRLTHPDEMGSLFQVLALTPGDARPPGFEE